jgi:hypothetical protein
MPLLDDRTSQTYQRSLYWDLRKSLNIIDLARAVTWEGTELV